MKFFQVFTRLLFTDRTIFQSFRTTAFPDIAGGAVSYQPPATGKASVTIDILWFETETEFFRI